ncbi:DUF1446 domain-containing protein [Verticiella sediminum]
MRIGGASAFWGDSNAGVAQLVRQGEIDVLVFDYLAELTMSLLQRARSKNPSSGYAGDFVAAVKPLLPEIAQRGIKLLSNAGGMNPQACAQALRQAAQDAGVALRIAVVQGDDLTPKHEAIVQAGVTEMGSGAPLPDTIASMNAYLGALPVMLALENGADVVITGRCVDSALSLGALAHHFGWRSDDYDRLAAGSLVGHILECTTQVTGGLFTDWWRVPGWENMGFPIAECAEDGSFVLTKPPGTGGLIEPAVVSEQMLYEIGDPARYLLPDVTCDFTGVSMEQVGPDRVRLSGARGRPPTDRYKVSATWSDGYRVSSTLTIVGEDAADCAERLGPAIFARASRMMLEAGLGDFTETLYEVLGSERATYGASARGGHAREVVLRIAARHHDPAALEILAREIAPFGVSGAPGTTGFSGRPKVQPVVRLFSFLWPKRETPVTVQIDGRTLPVQIPSGASSEIGTAHEGRTHPPTAIPAGETATVPLAAIAVARSGDKGDISNIALIARHPRFVALIAEQITEQAVAAYFAHLVRGRVTRHDVPGVHAFNFVLEQALAGGGAASLRNDPLGKTLGQVLLGHPVRVPVAWLPETVRKPAMERA